MPSIRGFFCGGSKGGKQGGDGVQLGRRPLSVLQVIGGRIKSGPTVLPLTSSPPHERYIGAPFASCSDPFCQLQQFILWFFQENLYYAGFIWYFHKGIFRNACANNSITSPSYRFALPYLAWCCKGNELLTLSIHLSSGCKVKLSSASQPFCFGL